MDEWGLPISDRLPGSHRPIVAEVTQSLEHCRRRQQSLRRALARQTIDSVTRATFARTQRCRARSDQLTARASDIVGVRLSIFTAP